MSFQEFEKYFVQERIDEDWVWIVKNRVGKWIDQKGNSGLWDCVNTYSQYLGILKKGLIRKDFAALIVSLQPKGLKKGKTREQLKGSMEHFDKSLKLELIDSYSENSERGKIVKELEKLFNDPIPSTKQEPTSDTVESRMKEYLMNIIADQPNASLFCHETYCGFKSSLSVETYASEKFKNERKPSVICVVECVESKVSEDTILHYFGKYSEDRKIKLVIAASSGFNERIKKTASDRNVCLIRVNPNYEITEKDILTPRMENGSFVHQYEHDMLSGRCPMTVPMVILDGNYTTTSLTDYLIRNDIPVINPGSAHAPMLPRNFIENVVSELIKDDVEKYAGMLKQCGPDDKVPYCFIDPYKYAQQDGLKVIRTNLSEEHHLGHIDMKNKIIRLSDEFEENSPNDRFSMGHEYGHYSLHSDPRFIDFLKRDAELAGKAASDIWEKHWLEVQANTFASYMLMPRELVRLLYNLYWRKRFKSDEVKPMIIAEPMFHNENFQHVVGPVSRHLGVSLEAMKFRLCRMGLLIDPKSIDIELVV